jgi:predicted transport protein
VSLARAIEAVRQTAEELKASGSANEANTRALLIDPLLAALGWNLTDLSQVDREYRVYDGTTLDYALKADGEPRLFVEAKGVTRKLDDKAFIAQVVNYANNEGVQWCVLTNGLSYRVYKTNEPVGMDQKLLFEVDLTEDAGQTSRESELDLIGREAVSQGRLDEWGERVFTDARVREAVGQLAAVPPPELVRRLQQLLGKPEIADDRLKQSLARILGAEPTAASSAPPPIPKPHPRPPRGKRADYALDHHLGNKPTAIVDLFEQLDNYGQGLGGDVTRRIKKFYVGYFAGSKERSFFTVEIQRRKLLVYLSLNPASAPTPWNNEAMRDVKEIGHYGMGDTEYVLTTADQLDETKALIKQAYERVH